ncbi:MAG TPA: hypothetical protein V6D20_08845 [Candidatus Obscuribacterales bacterium]
MNAKLTGNKRAIALRKNPVHLPVIYPSTPIPNHAPSPLLTEMDRQGSPYLSINKVSLNVRQRSLLV